ncbi:MAG: hypothetical protein ABIN94_08915 [Ferruginibacter sp.]
MMVKKATPWKDIWILIPLFGGILFILIYLIAAFLYPGGSQANISSVGFSWIHNYWCNLLNSTAMNGDVNPARPVAITGMVILCISLAVFWYQFSRLMKFGDKWRKLMQASGILSMITAFFIFSPYHDIIIPIAGIMATFAIVGTFIGLYKMRWTNLFWFGIMNLVLMVLNNFIYYTHEFIAVLPVVQKITFLSFLIWISIIDICLYKFARK